jgi:hypothetical protein
MSGISVPFSPKLRDFEIGKKVLCQCYNKKHILRCVLLHVITSCTPGSVMNIKKKKNSWKYSLMHNLLSWISYKVFYTLSIKSTKLVWDIKIDYSHWCSCRIRCLIDIGAMLNVILTLMWTTCNMASHGGFNKKRVHWFKGLPTFTQTAHSHCAGLTASRA